MFDCFFDASFGSQTNGSLEAMTVTQETSDPNENFITKEKVVSPPFIIHSDICSKIFVRRYMFEDICSKNL